MYDFNAVTEAIQRTSTYFHKLGGLQGVIDTHNMAFKYLGQIFRNTGKANIVLDAGWVPFPGMNLERSNHDDPPKKIRDHVRRTTLKDWTIIKANLLSAVMTSGVDKEAVATFKEAVLAYEGGLYRSVVRVLFPEIERVSKLTFYDGSASLKKIREAVMKDIPAGVSIDDEFGFALTTKMNEHLYDRVGDDPQNIQRFRNDPIPNRHASIHALVRYNSRQNAFNTLAMACFMFQLFMRVKPYIIYQNTLSQPKP